MAPVYIDERQDVANESGKRGTGETGPLCTLGAASLKRRRALAASLAPAGPPLVTVLCFRCKACTGTKRGGGSGQAHAGRNGDALATVESPKR